jgi:hypothetical protein
MHIEAFFESSNVHFDDARNGRLLDVAVGLNGRTEFNHQYQAFLRLQAHIQAGHLLIEY